MANDNSGTEYISLYDERFPFIISMYDPTDCGHTRGIPEYFCEQIEEAIKENGENIQSLEAEKALILSLDCDYIIVGDGCDDEEKGY